jgi:tetratricopeptide (TPR) repeat protein
MTLAAWLKERSQPVPAREAAQLIATLAEAVDYAHKHEVVHRDLKPANVLLQMENQAPQAALGNLQVAIPRITDFGLAKSMAAVEDGPAGDASGQTQSRVLLGTPSYMAPEQASGRSRTVGPAADVYALGSILYELLAGRPPFLGETTLDTLEMVRTQEPVPPRRLTPKLSRDLETICLKCLEKDAAGRYPSAAALAEDLRYFVAGLPIRARPPRPWTRAIKRARRHPALAALGVVSAAAAVALVSVVTFYSARLGATNAQLTEALATAQDKERQAEDNFSLARQGVFDLATRLSQEPRLCFYDLEELRKDELLAALAYFDELAQRQPNDSGVQAERGLVYLLIGRILSQIRGLPIALSYLKKAEDLLRQVVHEHPTAAPYRRHLVRVCLNLGLAYLETGRRDLAEQYYREAFAFADELVRRQPDAAEFLILLAQGHNSLGALYLDGEQLELAETALARSTDFTNRLVRDHPCVPVYQGLLAESLNYRGVLYQRTGRLEQAAAIALRARDLGKTLVTYHPNVDEFRNQLARSWRNLGDAYSATGQLVDAEVAYEQARDLLWDQSSRHPHSRGIYTDLAAVLLSRVVFYEDTGRLGAAWPNFPFLGLRRGETCLDPTVPDIWAYAAAGRLNGAVACRQNGNPQWAELETCRECAVMLKLVRAHPDRRPIERLWLDSATTWAPCTWTPAGSNSRQLH